MRKYRGKHIESGEWIYGYFIGSDVIVGDIVEWDSEYFNTEFWCKVDPETVGQYTGLQDNNGKEIYEGDILQDKRFDSGIGKVYFDTELGVWKVGFYEEDWLSEFYDCSEVIGNLWDNPELLGEVRE